MERLEKMKDCLIACVESQIYNNLEQVDTKELGEAIDMIKDLAETMYYWTVTEAMVKKEKEVPEEAHYYYEPKTEMKDLESYMHELTEDVMKMIENLTSEEKQMLRQKMTSLVAKIK